MNRQLFASFALAAATLASLACADLSLVHVDGAGGARANSSSSGTVDASASASTSGAGGSPKMPPNLLVGSYVVGPNEESDYHPAGLANAGQFSAIASGRPGKICVYLTTGSDPGNPVDVGIYTDDGMNHPSQLVAIGSIGDALPGSWSCAPAAPPPDGGAPPSLSEGTLYWLAALAPLGGTWVDFGFNNNTINQYWEHSGDGTPLSTLPDTWAPPTTNGTEYGQNGVVQMYATQ